MHRTEMWYLERHGDAVEADVRNIDDWLFGGQNSIGGPPSHIGQLMWMAWLHSAARLLDLVRVRT